MTLRIETPTVGHGQQGTTIVAVASVSDAMAPVALRIEDTEGALGHFGMVELRRHDDALWRRFGERYGYDGLSGADAILDASRDPDRYDNPFSAGPDVPLASRAADLLVIDGTLWERVPEPVAYVHPERDGDPAYATIRWEVPDDPAGVYRLDEISVLATVTGMSWESLPTVEVLDPGCLSHDALAHLVRRAAREAAEFLGERGPVKGAHGRRLAFVAEQGRDADDVDTILDAMADHGISDGHPSALREVSTRIDAIRHILPELDAPSVPSR